MLVGLDKDGYEEIIRIKSTPNSLGPENEEYKFLFDGRFLVQSNQNEVNKLMLTTLARRFDPNSLSLTIAPTRACNFKCHYCYEKDRINKALFLKKVFEEGIYTKDIYPFRASKGCMSQQLNAYVIGPEGELYKCWHHLGVKEKEVGNIFVPHTITNYALLSDMMVKGDVILDNQCKSCTLFPSCSGGCTDNKNRNEDFCIPAKSMLEEFIDIHYIVKNYSCANKNADLNYEK